VKSFWKSMISSASAISSPPGWFNRSPVRIASQELRGALLSPTEAEAMDAHGRTEAAVLLPLYGLDERPGLVFTERRADLRRHAGEISFPGGRRDHPDEPLLETALREAEEEIALDRGSVEILGALPPVSTVVTSYKVHPFVGLLEPGPAFVANPAEVAAVLMLDLDELRDGYAMRRLIKRGVPIRTPTYEVGDHMIWGATARILGSLLERLDATPGAS
jgi:8-oxo-dGTP pyrophosphatase MutT (NUDIX family)